MIPLALASLPPLPPLPPYLDLSTIDQLVERVRPIGMQRATDQSDPPVLLDGIGTPAVGARSQQNARTTPIAGSNGTFRARPAQHASDREAVAIAMRDAEARLQSFQNVVYDSISPILVSI